MCRFDFVEIFYQSFDFPLFIFCKGGREINIIDFNNPKKIKRIFL